MQSSVTKRPNFTMVQLRQHCNSVELHFELHPSSFSATTFSISIVENLERGVVDWEVGPGLMVPPGSTPNGNLTKIKLVVSEVFRI